VFDADTATKPNPNKRNCFGYFNIQLAVQGIQGAIGNPSADTYNAPPGSVVIGPVTFRIQLEGPGVHTLTSSSFATATSIGGQPNVNVAVKFQAGGTSGESGTLGNGGSCPSGFFVRGTPRLGQHIDICIVGAEGCHGCPWASMTEGPVVVAGITIPIGLPILAVFDLGVFANGVNELCIPVDIPNNPALVGSTFYFTSLGYPGSNASAFAFSPAFRLVILP
jgi:hypothetical protein